MSFLEVLWGIILGKREWACCFCLCWGQLSQCLVEVEKHMENNSSRDTASSGKAEGRGLQWAEVTLCRYGQKGPSKVKTHRSEPLSLAASPCRSRTTALRHCYQQVPIDLLPYASSLIVIAQSACVTDSAIHNYGQCLNDIACSRYKGKGTGVKDFRSVVSLSKCSHPRVHTHAGIVR